MLRWLARRRREDREERQEERETRMIEKLADAIGQAFGATLQAQAQVMKQNSDFLTELQSISAKKAASIMGQRGGRTTQARKRIAKQAAVACPMCVNPARRDVTVQMLDFHRMHGEMAPETLREPTARELLDAQVTAQNGNG